MYEVQMWDSEVLLECLGSDSSARAHWDRVRPDLINCILLSNQTKSFPTLRTAYLFFLTGTMKQQSSAAQSSSVWTVPYSPARPRLWECSCDPCAFLKFGTPRRWAAGHLCRRASFSHRAVGTTSSHRFHISSSGSAWRPRTGSSKPGCLELVFSRLSSCKRDSSGKVTFPKSSADRTGKSCGCMGAGRDRWRCHSTQGITGPLQATWKTWSHPTRFFHTESQSAVFSHLAHGSPVMLQARLVRQVLESVFELLLMFRKSREGGVALETQNRKSKSLDDPNVLLNMGPAFRPILGRLTLSLICHQALTNCMYI